MNQETRIKYLEDLKKDKGYSYKDIYYQGKPQKLSVFRINLEYLIYNRWNGRIASLVKSYESEYGVELDTSNDESVKKIEEFLWKSNETANKATYSSLYDQGQKEYGIVTKDGVIIDGNRRALLLNKKANEKKEKPAYFLAVVLNEKLMDNHKEIMRLEAEYQMGEDAKVDYEPIEKYLKCKDMKAEGFSEAEIGNAMGEDTNKIKEYLEIMGLMDNYLNFLGYKGIYTRLDKTEDLFISLNKVLKKWKDKSGKVQWNFKDTDRSDLTQICFDYIRYVYNMPKGIQSKEVRDSLIRNSEDSIFAHQKIWQDFSEKHRKIDQITKEEPSVDKLRAASNSRSLSSVLKSRDEMWAKKVDPIMKENFWKAKDALINTQNRNEPLKLLQGADAKMDAIDIKSPAFLNDKEVFTIVDTIRKKADDFKKIIIKHQKQK